MANARLYVYAKDSTKKSEDCQALSEIRNYTDTPIRISAKNSNNSLIHLKPRQMKKGVCIGRSDANMAHGCKKNIGRKLYSEPIIADANCTKICVYMSLVLLVSSLVYELNSFAYADAIGSAGLIYFSVSEGKEVFEKVKGKECSCEIHNDT